MANITQEQVTHDLQEVEKRLLDDPANVQARQWLWSAYWGLADLHYNRGDFDGHMGLLKSVVEVSDRVAAATGLDQYPHRFIAWEGTCGLGHLAQGLDTHVKAVRLGLKPKLPTFILAAPGVVANPHYLGYWRPFFAGIITAPALINLLIPLGGARGYFGCLEDHYVVSRIDGKDLAYCEAAWEVARQWEARCDVPLHLLNLRSEDTERGCEALRKMGMPPGAWFATLHVRESNNWDHAQGRNVALSDYFPAIGEIVARGGWVVRIGNPQMTPLPPMPNVIDLAHSEARADWLDVFAMGACRFFLGTQSGPVEAAQTFGVPCLTTNWQLGFRRGYSVDTSIFRRYKVGGKFVSMEEALEKRYAFIESPGMFTPGVEAIPNTPEEIRELVAEWLDGVPPSEADQARLAEFDALQRRVMASHVYQPAGYCEVGRKWLERVLSEEA